MTRKIYLLLLVLPFVFGIVNAQADAKDGFTFGKAVFKAIVSGDNRLLSDYCPDADVYRSMDPMLANKTDEEIMKEIPLDAKREKDMTNIMESLKTSGKTADDFNITGVNFSIISPGDQSPVGIEIKYDVNGTTGGFGISAIKVEDKWYMLEILNSVGVFDHLK